MNDSESNCLNTIPFDRQELLSSILEEVENGTMELGEQTPEYVEVYDYQDDKYIRFRTAPITVQSIADMICISSLEPDAAKIKHEIAQALIHLPAETFAVTKAILLPETEEDVAAMCAAMGFQEEMWPDKICFGEFLSSSCLGLSWFYENTVIVNIAAVKLAAKEIFETPHSYSLQHEESCAFWTTLFHELRHVMLDCNPFLSEIDYPVSLAAEKAVEEYCRETFEKFQVNGWLN